LVAHTEGGTWAEGAENRVLKRIFGPKMDEGTGEWSKQHNEELNDIQGVPGGKDLTSGECSLGQTIPI